MDEKDILVILPKIYHLDNMPRTECNILKDINLTYRTMNYKKIRELADMGLLVRSDEDKFISDKKKIWNFWKDTPIGMTIIKMVNDANK